MKITKKTEDRMKASLPKFRKVLEIAKVRDLNESDTVAIITDMLSEVFGFEKYLEITSELCIKSTYCDLAIKLGDKFQLLIECKAIGIGDLKEVHMRQAITYGANSGVPWVLLTNGIDWQLYKIRYEQPVSWDLVERFDLLQLDPKDPRTYEKLFILTKEGIEKGYRDELWEKNQCVNRFVVGQLMRTEPVVSVIKRELKRIAEGARIEDFEIMEIINNGVLRRDLIEGEQALAAEKIVKKAQNKAAAPKPKKEEPKQEEPKPTTSLSLTEQLLDEATKSEDKPSDPPQA